MAVSRSPRSVCLLLKMTYCRCCRCRCRAELSVEQALAHGQRERVGLVGQHALAGRIDEHLVVGVLEQLSEPHECHLVQAWPGNARQLWQSQNMNSLTKGKKRNNMVDAYLFEYFDKLKAKE